MPTMQSKLVSRTIWLEKKKIWKINIQKNGIRKSFYSSTPGDKGRKICAQNWPCKRPSTDVKLVAGRVTALPCLGYSNVSVGPGCALYRDDRFLQLAVEIFRIQCAEDFFKVSSGPGCFDGFFHFCVLTFVFPIFAHVIPSG